MANQMIDLNDDNDNIKQDTTTTEKVEGPVGIVKVSSGMKTNDVYDRYQKLVYVFDVSCSMQDGMTPGELDALAIWTPEIIQQLQDALKKVAKESRFFDAKSLSKMHFEDKIEEANEELAKLNAELAEFDPNDFDDADEAKDARRELKEMIDTQNARIQLFKNPTPEMLEEAAINKHWGFDITSVMEVKQQVYYRNLDRQLKVPVVRTGVGLSTVSKVEALKRSAEAFINKRFEKYPDADISIIEFCEKVKVRKRGASKEELLHIVNNLTAEGGGTDIYLGVRKGVDEVLANPSPVGTNHIVLFTDGESNTVTYLAGMVAEMKQNNIVLDLICLLTPAARLRNQFVNAVAEVARATGGEVTMTDNADTLNKKLFEVSNRLMIPAKL